MTQEQKDILLKDLCARLPYGVKIALKNNGAYHHENIAKKGDVTIDILKGFNGNYFSIRHTNPLDWDWYDDDIDIEDIKPYLFPLSSMTEEQWIDTPYANLNKFTFDSFKCGCSTLAFETYEVNLSYVVEFINWCYKNHFDIYGLIPKGLAEDATGKNIY